MRPPPDIAQLSEAMANQIAAGEVIERPAAVVKELAENSLDAGATRVDVASEDGGRRLIRVADDGHGMRPDDLALALTRHATSKIRTADDLFRIGSLGFRGEALPSIAAVSEFSLASRPHAAEAGHQVVLAGGRPLRAGACAMPPGTRVEVRNLFWNVPARLKFLKSEAAETGHITDQVVRLALAHPRVGFRLETDGRTALDLPPVEDLTARVRAVFDDETADALLPVEAQGGAMQLTGFVAHPRTARPTGRRQFLFLNGRFVKDRILVAAVKEGCKGFLEPRLHLALFLHLEIEPSQVDVNVHPTKAEVRFRSEGEVFALVVRGLRAALESAKGAFRLLDTGPIRAAAQTQAQAQAPSRVPAPAPLVVVQERFLPPPAPVTEAPPLAGLAMRPAPAIAPWPPAEPLSLREADASPPAQPASAAAPTAAEAALARVRRVVQLHRMFLLIETDSGIRLVDQHAIHEKALWLMLDPATSDLLSGGRQTLLVPVPLRLTAAEVAALAPLVPALDACGIGVAVEGARASLVSYPARLARLDWTGLCAALAADGLAAVDDLRTRLGHRAACHAAIKAGQELSQAEMLELVRLLFTMDGLEHCPHGRPTTLDLTWDDLARRFQR
jgi:DNA mismatch repair protein MutL